MLTRISRVPPKESYATPDDGFNEKDTSNRVDFAHPGTRKEFVHPPDKAKFIVKETVPEVCYEDGQRTPHCAGKCTQASRSTRRTCVTVLGKLVELWARVQPAVTLNRIVIGLSPRSGDRSQEIPVVSVRCSIVTRRATTGASSTLLTVTATAPCIP